MPAARIAIRARPASGSFPSPASSSTSPVTTARISSSFPFRPCSGSRLGSFRVSASMKCMAERASISRRLVALVIVALLAWPAGPATAQAGRELYIKGLEHLDAKRWAEAIQAFDAAIQADPKENKGARLYGMRYGYFPYRDKGVALYNLGRYDEA